MNFHKQVSIALLCCLAGCAIGPQTVPAPIAAERSSNDVPAGKKLYAQHCAACHGVDALGGTRAPSLHTPSVQSMPGSALVQFLADGDLRNGMPSWSRLPEERRWQLARYIQSLSPSNETDHRSRTG
jgi:mono/diheme cytochrome c family protein